MPIKKAALKRMRADKKRHQINTPISNELKTKIKRIRGFITDKKKDEASALLPAVASKLHKAVHRKLIHKNKAARTLSRLEKTIKSINKG
ncbi:MAG: 30S ribosomal protein S20 [Candidatus Omnitrophota bacterium]